MTPSTDVGTVEEFANALEESDIPIRLTGDLELANQYAIGRDIELNLNGHTLSSSLSSPLFIVNGKLRIEGGTAETRKQLAWVKDGGEVTVENGTYNATEADVIRVGTNGTVIVNGGELTGREGAIACRDGGSTVIVNGGNLVGTDNYAVATNGSNDMGNNTIVINGGALEGNIKSPNYEAIALYVPNNDDVTINGGLIEAHGGTAICQRAGRITINDGTIVTSNVDKNGNIVVDGKIGDDPTVMTGCSAIIFHETSNYPGQQQGEMSLTINGGVIMGVDESVQVLSNAAEPKVYVNGGQFDPPYPKPEPEPEPEP